MVREPVTAKSGELSRTILFYLVGVDLSLTEEIPPQQCDSLLVARALALPTVVPFS